MSNITLYEGRFLSLLSKDGWEYVTRKSSGVVIIIPVHNNILTLVKQYRPPVDSEVIELPAGLVGDIPGQEKESSFGAAARELEEETGYRANSLKLLATNLTSSPGLTNESFDLFLASDLEKVSDGGGDSNEDITVVQVGLNNIHNFLESQKSLGIMIDPKIYMVKYFMSL